MTTNVKSLIQIGVLFLVAFLIVPFLSNRGPTQTEDDDGLSADRVAEENLDGIRFQLISRDPARSLEGFLTLPLSGPDEILLVNEEGETIHRWPVDAARARLQPDCSLLVVHGSKIAGEKDKWRDLKPHLRLYSWEGEVLWEYVGNDWIHHDAHVLPNGNIVFLEKEEFPFPSNHPRDPLTEGAKIRSSLIKEVDRTGAVVWQWAAHDHLDLVNCGYAGCEKKQRLRKRGDSIWDWTHANTASPLPENALYDAGDKRFKSGNVLFLPRSFWTGYLIDKESGEVVWSYEGEYQNGVLVDGMVRGHEIHMIPKGFPGASNMLVVDNGLDGVREFTKVIEINPLTKETVWKYEDSDKFFTRGGGSAQRLKSGNTLISEDVNGRVIEVTPENEIVWEGRSDYRISRAHFYPPQFCPRLSSRNPQK